MPEKREKKAPLVAELVETPATLKGDKRRGRKQWNPTPEELGKIEDLAGQGLTVSEICESLGFSESTFYKHSALRSDLSEALKRGQARGRAYLKNALFQKIKKGSTAALIFALKVRAGWNERIRLVPELPEGYGHAAAPAPALPEPLSDEERIDNAAEIFRILEEAGALQAGAPKPGDPAPQ